MKTLTVFLCALIGSLTALMVEAAPVGSDSQAVAAEIRRAIDAAERVALENQSLEDLNTARQEQVIRDLNLTDKQRRTFEPLYRSYRAALAKAVSAESGNRSDNESVQRQQLKDKLANISAAAQVKRDYVDRFAEVLSAEQIRKLYNTEDQIGSNIRREIVSRRGNSSKEIVGSGRSVTQELGRVGNYTSIRTSSFIHVTVSASASTVRVTADDNLIDRVKMEQENGGLVFRFDQGGASSISNIHISIVVPASIALNRLSAGSYSTIDCEKPLQVASAAVAVSSYGKVTTDIVASGTVKIDISSFGKFVGKVDCGSGSVEVSSYALMQGDIQSRGNFVAEVDSYAKLRGNLAASGSLTANISSYGAFSGDLCGDALTLAVSSYAQYKGAVRCSSARLTLSTGASAACDFTGNSFTAQIDSYAKLQLLGAAKVASGKAVLTGATFSAPDLQVADYDLSLSAYSSANVNCTKHLRVNTSRDAKLDYTGSCTVETISDNIRRR